MLLKVKPKHIIALLRFPISLKVYGHKALHNLASPLHLCVSDLMSTTLASDSFPPASFSKDLPWFLGFPDSSIGKESACNAGDPGSIPGLGRSTGEGIGYPFQYSWASLVAQLVKNLPAMQETWVGKIPWKRERLPILVFWPGEFHELYSPLVRKESDTTSLSLFFLYPNSSI